MSRHRVPLHHDLPPWFWSLSGRPGAVLLHSAKPDADQHVSWLYLDPSEVLPLQDARDIRAFLAKAERCRKAGRWIAGFVGYEAGYALVGEKDPPHAPGTAAWFGVYDGVWRFDHRTAEATRLGEGYGASGEGSHPLEREDGQPSGGESLIGSTSRRPHPVESLGFGPFGLTEPEYSAKLERILAYIRAGDTYQVNFTDRFDAPATDLLEAYRRLVASHPVSYGAFLNPAGMKIASLSPELFFRTVGRSITTRPMKGTAPRGRDNAEDEVLAEGLRADPKSRAENVMIVDLLRNDLGRVCEYGSVRVPELFTVERYRSVQQMTSTVTGTLQARADLPAIFEALFPCGSVTGAPKRRTMQIIRELERGPRGVYTGAIGHASPDGDATFNVAIRTLVQTGIEPAPDRGASATPGPTRERRPRITLGAGGGIVADSDPAAEFREVALKARFATRLEEPFELIETMRWDRDYAFLDAHLARLAGSADYFGFAFDVEALRRALLVQAASFPTGEAQRVGVRVEPSGSFRIRATACAGAPLAERRVVLARERVDSADPYLRHKTTRRPLYDRARARAEREGWADVLFLNERGELTEGAISNVFLLVGGELLTPPLDAGVLPGVGRAHVLETDPRARVATLRADDLHAASTIYLCSALRGLRPVSWERAPARVRLGA